MLRDVIPKGNRSSSGREQTALGLILIGIAVLAGN